MNGNHYREMPMTDLEHTMKELSAYNVAYTGRTEADGITTLCLSYSHTTYKFDKEGNKIYDNTSTNT